MLSVMNIGGNANLLMVPIKEATSQLTALIILFPGLYVAGAVVFTFSWLVLRKQAREDSYAYVQNVQEES